MRKPYIDNTRSLTILLVVLYHVIYMFNHVATDGVIGPVTAFHGQDALQYLLYPWFMVILFILSGMCSRFYLEKHTEKEYIRARTRKLLVPSTIGILVFGWAQGYFNMAISHAFDNIPETIPEPVLYLILCVSGTGVLWTIQVMWILSMILLLIRKLEKGRLSVLAEKAGILTALLLGILIYGSAQILCIPFWYLRNGISDRVLCVYSGKSDKGTGEILAVPAPCSICGRDPLHLCILWEKLCGGALRKQSSGSTVWMADVPCSDRRHETLCRQRKQWVAAPEAEKLWTLCVPLSAVICLRICTVYLYESSGYPAVCSDRAGSFLWWSAFV